MNIKSLFNTYKKYGTRSLLTYFIDKNFYYKKFLKKQLPNKKEIIYQKNKLFDIMPYYFIITPTYNTNPRFLKEYIYSIIKQTYSNWTLVLIDGASTNKKTLEVLKQFDSYDNIQIIYQKQNLGISGNTNIGLQRVKFNDNNYIVFCDHDDLLTPNCLYILTDYINKTKAEFLYSDEDKMNNCRHDFCNPSIKADISIDRLRSCNYISHLSCVKQSLLNKVGFLSPEKDGAQDYDMTFRLIEATNKICHIPYILYHWRIFNSSMYAQQRDRCSKAGVRSLTEHLDRVHENAKVSTLDNYYKTSYPIKSNPKVSVIFIHTINNSDILFSSFINNLNYDNVEYIIADYSCSL